MLLEGERQREEREREEEAVGVRGGDLTCFSEKSESNSKTAVRQTSQSTEVQPRGRDVRAVSTSHRSSTAAAELSHTHTYKHAYQPGAAAFRRIAATSRRLQISPDKASEVSDRRNFNFHFSLSCCTVI